MAEKKESHPTEIGGFEALADTLLNPISVQDDIPIVDPDDIKDDIQDDDNLDQDDTDDVDDKDTDDVDVDVDDSTIDGDDVDDKVDYDLTEFEPDIAEFFQDRLKKELGWEFNEDEKFKSVADVIGYMGTLVEENSKPDFANDEIKELDDFVRGGGNLKDFYKEVYTSTVDIDTLDLTKESDQKSAVREELKLRGFKSDRIDRTIERYEDSEALEEESESSAEFLKNYKEEKREKLLEDSKKESEVFQKQQQKFFNDVQDNIKSLKNIRGISISDKEKKEIVNYIFKPDSNGVTQYQKEYMSDVKNLIESAFFTKMGDALFDRAKNIAASDAHKKMHQKLKTNKGKLNKNIGGSQEDDTEQIDLFSKLSKVLKKV